MKDEAKCLHLFYAAGDTAAIIVNQMGKNERRYPVNDRNTRRIQNLVKYGDVRVSHIFDPYGSSTFISRSKNG